jgi:hypothetical protein
MAGAAADSVVVCDSAAEASRLLEAPGGATSNRLRIWPLDRLVAGAAEGLAARQAAAVVALAGRAWLPWQLLQYDPKYEVRARPVSLLGNVPAGA